MNLKKLINIYTYIHFGFGSGSGSDQGSDSGSGRVRVEDRRVRVGSGSEKWTRFQLCSREFPRNVLEKLQISVNVILEIVTRVNDPFQKEIDFLIYPRIDGFTIVPRSTYQTIQDFLFIEEIL